MAADFAEPFGVGDLMRLIGYTHDAGKLAEEVQLALRARAIDGGRRLGVPHKREGAALAGLLMQAGNPQAAAVMAMVNFGHHHQIPAHFSEPRQLLRWMGKHPGCLDDFVDRIDELLDVDLRALAASVRQPDVLGAGSTKEQQRRFELLVRMCHSTLVDADFLDTGAHFQPELRAGLDQPRGMDALRTAFLANHGAAFATAPDTDLNRYRAELFQSCIRTGADRRTAQEPGIYRLPGQTGSGKTMAAAAFALTHAASFDKRRVIVAVPFTSITTQNAAAYRAAFSALGNRVVLEHHSDVEDPDVPGQSWRRLSAENWDAEFIVTTTVQLFDSLFAANPKATRKLHRLVDSVVVLDEIQALPLKWVPAILVMLRDLVEQYGVTVLLASATQPSFWRLPEWSQGFNAIDIAEVGTVPEVTRRVHYEVRTEPLSWEDVASELCGHRQGLVIVNTTAAAQDVYSLLAGDDDSNSFHLSTRMCNAHRLDVLSEVRRRLADGQPIRLVSTQLIEAGVDVDFPLVMRALAPAESIIQSAGRCNREGRLGHRGGTVVVFEPIENAMPPGAYKRSTALTKSLFLDDANSSFEDPGLLDAYYGEVYEMAHAGDAQTEATDFAKLRADRDFPAVQQAFAMIDETSASVLIPSFGDDDTRSQVAALVERLSHRHDAVLTPEERRLVQRMSASIPKWVAAQSPWVTTLAAGVLLWDGEYDARGIVIAQSATVL